MAVVSWDLALVDGMQEVDDICEAAVVHQDPFGVESFYS